MDSNRIIEKEHALRVINEMFSSRGLEMNPSQLSETDASELEIYLSELTHFSLPGFLSKLMDEEPDLQKLWVVFSQLSSVEKKILIFSAQGFEAKLIVESLSLKNLDEYWKELDSANKILASHAKGIVEEELIRNLNKNLEQLQNEFLSISDRVEQEEESKSKRKLNVYIIPIGALVLFLSYIFIWNFVFPPSGEKLTTKSIHEYSLKELGVFADSLVWVETIVEGMEIQDYENTLLELDEEYILSPDMPAEYKCLHALLLLRSERYFEAREKIKELKYESLELYQEYFGSELWKIRFLN